MDAAAYLKGHGWKGLGHSLDQNGRGIVRPLLVSQKNDALGVGIQKHNVSDQWWMRAFDEGLKAIGTGQQTTLSQIRDKGISRGGLYGFFVKGEVLRGTLNPDIPTPELTSDTSSDAPSDTGHSAPSGTKRKRGKESREDIRKRRKEEKGDRARKNVLLKTETPVEEQSARKSKKRKQKDTESKQSNNQCTIASSVEVLPPSKTISGKKAAEYAKRAAEKGVSIEEYTARRVEKKAEKSLAKSKRKTATVSPKDTPTTSSKEESPIMEFVIDTIGDPSLNPFRAVEPAKVKTKKPIVQPANDSRELKKNMKKKQEGKEKDRNKEIKKEKIEENKKCKESKKKRAKKA